MRVPWWFVFKNHALSSWILLTSFWNLAKTRKAFKYLVWGWSYVNMLCQGVSGGTYSSKYSTSMFQLSVSLKVVLRISYHWKSSSCRTIKYILVSSLTNSWQSACVTSHRTEVVLILVKSDTMVSTCQSKSPVLILLHMLFFLVDGKMLGLSAMVLQRFRCYLKEHSLKVWIQDALWGGRSMLVVWGPAGFSSWTSYFHNVHMISWYHF